MPRFIVIAMLAVLGVGVAAGGAFLARQRWDGRGQAAERQAAGEQSEQGEQQGVLQPAQESDWQQRVPADDDNDGLLNDEESAWGTDPNERDSDGDGYLDGEEVAAKHDPTVPAPNDKLPEGGETAISKLGREIYADNVSLQVSSGNMTKEYERQYGGGGGSPVTREEFVNKQLVARLLPPVDGALMPNGMPNRADILARYLAAADNRSALADEEVYRAAQRDLREGGDAAAMRGIARTVRQYRRSLLETPVPVSALELHKLLLSYTEALAVTFDQVALWDEDPVKSLVATRQLETLDRKYYPVIRDELRRLRELQASVTNAGS